MVAGAAVGGAGGGSADSLGGAASGATAKYTPPPPSSAAASSSGQICRFFSKGLIEMRFPSDLPALVVAAAAPPAVAAAEVGLREPAAAMGVATALPVAACPTLDAGRAAAAASGNAPSGGASVRSS